jgi:DNA polymerase III sliding clamp (beta) subunit (PCNA family)
MSISIKLNATDLKTAVLFAGVKDARYYLNGVRIEATETETRYVATDGKALVVIRDQTTSNGIPSPTALVIPRDVVLAASKTNREIYLSCENDRWKIEFDFLQMHFTPVDGKYPEYARIVPAVFPLDASIADIDGVYSALFKKAAVLQSKGNKNSHFGVRQTVSGGPAGIYLYDDFDSRFAGVIMTLKRPALLGDISWAASPIA